MNPDWSHHVIPRNPTECLNDEALEGIRLESLTSDPRPPTEREQFLDPNKQPLEGWSLDPIFREDK